MPELSAADHAAIFDLYARYAVTLDEGDTDGFVACFTADARFTAPGTEVVGREALSAFATGYANGPFAGTRHHITTVAATAANNGASVRAYALVTREGEVVLAAVYDDDVVRDGKAWRFARHAITG
jgi:uncharacterized protein (TIGR02246 family)